MPRTLSGSIYESHGTWFASLTLGKRKHFKLSTCHSERDADARRKVLIQIDGRLRAAGKSELSEALCRQAAESDERRLASVVAIVDGVVAGTEREAPGTAGDPFEPRS